MVFGRKKDFASIIQELVEQRPRQKSGSDNRDTRTSEVRIGELRVKVEISGLEDLIRELREMKSAIRELVDLAKSSASEEKEESTTLKSSAAREGA